MLPTFKVISITHFWSRAHTSYPSLSLYLHTYPLLKHNSFQNSTEETKSNTQTHTEKGRNIIWRLVKHKMELCISLVHLITFKQTKTGSSQQVILDKENKMATTFILIKLEDWKRLCNRTLSMINWSLLHQNEKKKKKVFIAYWSSHMDKRVTTNLQTPKEELYSSIRCPKQQIIIPGSIKDISDTCKFYVHILCIFKQKPEHFLPSLYWINTCFL